MVWMDLGLEQRSKAFVFSLRHALYFTTITGIIIAFCCTAYQRANCQLVKTILKIRLYAHDFTHSVDCMGLGCLVNKIL